MLNGKRIVVVLPAYNAAKTLEQTYHEIPHDIVDAVILVDDASKDDTLKVAAKLGIETVAHDRNKGYGANQKTCYQAALRKGADIVIMVHPDYQYTPKLLGSISSLLVSGLYDVVLGSRILGNTALSGGMPLYKYVANRFLTFVENLLIAHKLSEFHTGYRGFTSTVLTSLRLDLNGDDFIFDNEMLVQAHAAGFRIGEISCPTLYFPGASSINFRRSLKYGLLCLWVGFKFFLHRKGLKEFAQFKPKSSTKGNK